MFARFAASRFRVMASSKSETAAEISSSCGEVSPSRFYLGLSPEMLRQRGL